MEGIRDFVLSLIAAASFSALFEGILPDGGGMKKYLRWMLSLILLLILITPLKEVLEAIPSRLAEWEAPAPDAADAGFTADDFAAVDALGRVNSIVAMHIEQALCEKFSMQAGEVSVRAAGERIEVEAKWKLGLVAEDWRSFIARQYGVEAEVKFHE